MRIIAISTLREYWEANPETRTHLETWVAEVTAAQWRNPAEIKATFRNASILPGRRVVFNIKGNDHRMIVAVAYLYQSVYIKFIGTHKEYDAINVSTVEIKK